MKADGLCGLPAQLHFHKEVLCSLSMAASQMGKALANLGKRDLGKENFGEC